ncbi:MAG: catalase family protein [Alphaproteobacteria bacterium]|nr:catalase family protein [Alphaproteobacteria bacterium]
MASLGDIKELTPVAGEAIPPGEPDAIRVIAGVIEKQVREDKAKSGLARRDAHAKAHCCVKAQFQVLDGLPQKLRVGVFAQPRTYDAWVRFSNGNGAPQADGNRDGRGMAVKLMDVEGSPSTTQDFVMINCPVFMVRNAIDYIDLQTKGIWGFFFPGGLKIRFHEMGVTARLFFQTVTNPLNIRYWSMVPYRFGGDTACKYSARPSGTPSPFTGTSGDSYLRANVVEHLSKLPATFDFMVQLRTDAQAMPVEDPTIEWPESKSPFVPVARITIPPQTFDTAAQNGFGENLSFTPWHCLDAHRPLGGINRVRRYIYEFISSLRHELNQAPRKEPASFDIAP